MPLSSIINSSVASIVPVISSSSLKSKSKVTAPELPPPLSPTPAVTLSISPASFVNDITPVELL